MFAFHGGWLSEFYPNAELTAPGLKQMNLNPGTVGRLCWDNLQVGTDAAGPETDEAVWLTPRLTDAANVTTPAGQSESYLFYRGVGNFAGPVRVRTDRLSKQLTIYTDLDTSSQHHFPAAWLVHVRSDGALAFRRLEGFTASASDVEPHLSSSSEFAETDFSPNYLAVLKGEMHDMLVKQGLYEKEATAMLNTWNRAYFESPGLRLFYVMPEELVDARMPLKLSVDADIARVMVARVELISPEQRELIERLRRGPVSTSGWLKQIPDSPAKVRFFTGRSDFGDLGVEIPKDYQSYLDLGRFRNALVRAEQRLRPTAELNQFMTTYRLQSALAGFAVESEKEPPNAEQIFAALLGIE